MAVRAYCWKALYVLYSQFVVNEGVGKFVFRAETVVIYIVVSRVARACMYEASQSADILHVIVTATLLE